MSTLTLAGAEYLAARLDYKAAKARKPKFRCGWCQTAERIERGETTSSKPLEWYADRCDHERGGLCSDPYRRRQPSLWEAA